MLSAPRLVLACLLLSVAVNAASLKGTVTSKLRRGRPKDEKRCLEDNAIEGLALNAVSDEANGKLMAAVEQFGVGVTGFSVDSLCNLGSGMFEVGVVIEEGSLDISKLVNKICPNEAALLQQDKAPPQISFEEEAAPQITLLQLVDEGGEGNPFDDLEKFGMEKFMALKKWTKEQLDGAAKDLCANVVSELDMRFLSPSELELDSLTASEDGGGGGGFSLPHSWCVTLVNAAAPLITDGTKFENLRATVSIGGSPNNGPEPSCTLGGEGREGLAVTKIEIDLKGAEWTLPAKQCLFDAAQKVLVAKHEVTKISEAIPVGKKVPVIGFVCVLPNDPNDSTVADKVIGFADDAKNVAVDVANGAKKLGGDAIDGVKNVAGKIKNVAGDAIDGAKNAAEAAFKKIKGF